MTKPKQKSYDKRCYDLARYFMPNEPEAVVEELAQSIQDGVEDFLSGYEAGGYGGTDSD